MESNSVAPLAGSVRDQHQQGSNADSWRHDVLNLYPTMDDLSILCDAATGDPNNASRHVIGTGATSMALGAGNAHEQPRRGPSAVIGCQEVLAMDPTQSKH